MDVWNIVSTLINSFSNAIAEEAIKLMNIFAIIHQVSSEIGCKYPYSISLLFVMGDN